MIGYVHLKDLVFVDGKLPSLKTIKRKVCFVPSSAKAIKLLEKLQEERSHLAVVVDEFGGMAGILTLENILEQLVGDIHDEFDDEPLKLNALADGTWLADGAIRLETLGQQIGIDFSKAEEDTLGGYVFSRLSSQLRVGDGVDVTDYHLEVMALEGLRVTQVKIRPNQKDSNEATGFNLMAETHSTKTLTQFRQLNDMF
ncbi:MAG: transporter associated domain-containing protein [Deinococcales bacterium]